MKVIVARMNVIIQRCESRINRVFGKNMSTSKLLLSFVLAVFVLCATSDLIEAAAPPPGSKDKTSLESYYERRIAQCDREIFGRQAFLFDKAAVKQRVEKLAAEVEIDVQDQRLATIKSEVEKDCCGLADDTTSDRSVISYLQEKWGEWKISARIKLGLMMLDNYATQLKNLRNSNPGAAQPDDELLLQQARQAVIAKVMGHVEAMSEEEFAKPNKDRLQELMSEKADCQRRLAEEKARKEKRRREEAWQRYDDRLIRSLLINLASYVAIMPPLLVSQIPYVKRKLNSLQLRQIDKDRLSSAFLGAYMTNFVTIMHGMYVALREPEISEVQETRDPLTTTTVYGPYVMLNYALLDLGYGYGSDFLAQKIGHTRLAKKYSEMLNKYESRLRQRCKRYDFVKHKLGCAIKAVMSFYGAREYIDGSQ